MKIEYSIDGAIGRITLNNPPANTLDRPVFADPDELTAFLGLPELMAVIVTGAGRHFCGGAGVESLEDSIRQPDVLWADLDRGKQLLETIAFAPVPVVARIQGQCLGAGLEIALACHFRIASDNAMLGFVECDRGVIPGLGGTAALLGEIPRRAWASLILSSRLIRGDDAVALGLVDRAVPTGRLDDETNSFVDELIADRSPRLIRAVMQAVHNGRRMARAEALNSETALFIDLVQNRGGL